VVVAAIAGVAVTVAAVTVATAASVVVGLMFILENVMVNISSCRDYYSTMDMMVKNVCLGGRIGSIVIDMQER
jgi:hypothetical protein